MHVGLIVIAFIVGIAIAVTVLVVCYCRKRNGSALKQRGIKEVNSNDSDATDIGAIELKDTANAQEENKDASSLQHRKN